MARRVIDKDLRFKLALWQMNARLYRRWYYGAVDKTKEIASKMREQQKAIKKGRRK